MTDVAPTAPAELAVPFSAPAEPANASEVAAAAATESVANVQRGNPVVAEVAQDVADAANDVAAGKGISDKAASIIRTATPSLVGAGLAELASLGVHVPAAYTGVIDLGAAFVIGLGYYTLVRFIETKAPKAGWLLGVPVAPKYGA